MGEKKRAQYGRLAGWVGIICNILLSAGSSWLEACPAAFP